MAREMKDSGIEWLEAIPCSWSLGRIGQLYSERRQKVSDTEYAPLSVTMKGILPQLSTAAKTDAHDDRKLVCKGDFAINSRSDRRGSCGISEYDGSVSLINIVLSPRNNMNPTYYNWLFHSTMFSSEFYKWGHGIVNDLWTTGWQDMKRISIPVPPIDEQHRIADFLDRKCAEIDRVLEKTRASIEEYKKLKQSVITQAVTKGIRGEREMKDSGIEWIGEIPKEWNIRKLKYCCSTRNIKYDERQGNLTYIALENIVSWTSKYIPTESQYDISQSILCNKGDIIFGKLRPYLAKVYLVDKSACCSGEFAVFCNFYGYDSFYKYLFLSHGFINTVDASTYGTKMPRANVDFIRNLLIPLPDLSEQTDIAKYLDRKCSEIDTLISKKEQLITELEAYKKSLIYEYVTGKKEVI